MCADAQLLTFSCSAAVAFYIYDLDNTGYIEPDEIKRFLAELLRDNPNIILDSTEIDEIVEKVVLPVLHDIHPSKLTWTCYLPCFTFSM